MSLLKEKIAICYICSGETFRETALDKLQNYYKDNDNFYYLILTDNKEYFNKVNRKNLIVNEIKDFYTDYPHVKKYESIIEAKDKNEYAKTFVDSNYLFSFSLMRFHLLQAFKHNISNIAMMCTDTSFNPDNLQHLPQEKNIIYNSVSEWDENISKYSMNVIAKFLKDKYNYISDEKVRVLDAAGRFFLFKDIDQVKNFFDIWDNTIQYLYKSKNINHFKGAYVINDEYILAPIYRMFGLNNKYSHAGNHRLFEVKHNIKKERFWRTLGYEGLKEHHNYEEFLKINNLNNG